MYPLDKYDKRCYRYHEPGHLSYSCESDIICAYCAGPHKAGSVDCVADSPSCSNCMKAKSGYVKHPVYSSKCPLNN